MKLNVYVPLAITMLMGACAETGISGSNTGYVNVPESVVAMAAPNQDLNSVRILPEDGCYWYEHSGPVETTLLPLRNVEGRPICTRPQA